MNQFDENELRKKIRSDLQKKHQEKNNNNEKKIDSAAENEDRKLSSALKNRIRQIEEDRIFSKYPQFIRCENHLHETTWLTALEKAEQHEFFDFEETRWQKIKKRFFKNEEKLIPKTKEIDEYRIKISKEIEKDLESRLEKYNNAIKQYEHKKQKNRVDEIIEQEEEAFYRSHPDYKLYRNYLGDTKWLTDEEAALEEEYTDKVRTTKEKFVIYSGWTLLIIIILSLSYFFKERFVDDQNVGYVSISVNETRGQLYVDENLYLGFSNNLPIPLSVGEHKITYRKDGYISSPMTFDVKISLDDTVDIDFNLSPRSNDTQGLVKINAPFEDAKLFVNGEFSGVLKNNKNLFLPPGNHKIEIKKENFYVFPSSKDFKLTIEDTLAFDFSFRQKTNGKGINSAIKTGLLEVNSNVKGARIFLNREDTGLNTDYVFNKLPFGHYIITVSKDGYVSFPKEKEIKLSSSESYKKLEFNLTRETIPITIITRPVKGKIFINNREMGTGTWSGSLPFGKHQIRFGKVDYFVAPKATEFVVTENGKSELIFQYQSNFSIEFTPSGITPENTNASIQLGYIGSDDQFISDSRNGPQIRKSSELNDKIWWLGNAFNYRIPPANEAVALSFYLPERTEFGYDFNMKLWGYNSDVSYPLEISSGSNFRIVVNGIEIHEKYEPEYNLSEASKEKFMNFQLGNVLRYGKNTIVISTAKINKTFFVLWKIVIE